jgi:hypothetical protein
MEEVTSSHYRQMAEASNVLYEKKHSCYRVVRSEKIEIHYVSAHNRVGLQVYPVNSSKWVECLHMHILKHKLIPFKKITYPNVRNMILQ